MPPAPSTTPPTDVRSSHHEEDTEYLSKASYTAASESCVPPSPSAAAAEVARAATDGRVPDHRRPATRIAEHIPAISEFKALMVDEVNEKDLFHGVGLGRAMGTGHLPLRLVKLPVDDVSKVAVLSWRWDGDLEVRGSKNIAIAVHQAKKMGVRYLFIDLVSIDQCLSGDALMEQVVSFSSLYSTITVIAAYDKDGENRGRTMHRPWISSEVRQFLDSPAKTVYVTHKSTTLRSALLSPLFCGTLSQIRRGGFVKTILGILCDKIGMACVSNLKFIIPPYARILAAAYEKMSRNDYLLTAAILCRIHAPEGIFILWNIRAMNYNRCSFEEIGDVKDGYFSWTVYHIFLDQIQIGELRRGPIGGTYDLCYSFDALPHAEHVIFAALGMTDSAYGEFVAQAEIRRACLRTKAHKDEAKWRKPHVISVTL
ncbi:hypothetical protein RB601_003023 [Gaeumannomyces tritici]